MKKIMKILTVILICALLAGCGSGPAAQEAATAPTINPEPTELWDSAAMDPTDEPTEAPTEEPVPFVVETRPPITETQNQVTVTTTDEFLAAIAPNTEIIVNAQLIDLSKAAGYGETDGDYYYWEDAYDGPQLCIAEVSNLTIRGSGDDHNANVISSVPRYSNVLNFHNCSNIMVTGLTAGHTEEPGYCIGGVLFFLNCQDVLVEDCGLFGCGTFGVIGENSKNLQVVHNDIYECSVGGVSFTRCDAVNVDGNTFRDLSGPEFRVYNCGSVTCDGERVFDSYLGY